ncbi:MAG: hypothetical protein RJQ14_04095 [Marinoscillum sp.]
MLYFQSNKSSYSFTCDHEIIGKMSFPKWYSSNATVDYRHEKLELTQKSVWNSTYDILKKGFSIGRIKMDWKGFVKISLRDFNKRVCEFTVKHRGVLKSRYEVLDENRRLILTLHQTGHWFKVHPDFRVEVNRETSFRDQEHLCIYTLFAAKIFISHSAVG